MATFAEFNKKSIESAFKQFHKDNPKVYLLFKEQIFRAIRRGREKVSSKTLLGWLRWEVSLDVKTKDVYKINDAYTSRYSRIFIKEHPEYSELFNFRRLRDKSEKATERPWDKNLIEILRIMNDDKKYPNVDLVKYPTGSCLLLWNKKVKRKVTEKLDSKPVTTIQFNKLFKMKFIRASKKNYDTKHNKGMKSSVISNAGKKFLENYNH